MVVRHSNMTPLFDLADRGEAGIEADLVSSKVLDFVNVDDDRVKLRDHILHENEHRQ